MKRAGSRRIEKHSDDRNSIIRVTVAAVLLGIQVAWLIYVIVHLQDRWPWIATAGSYVTVFVLVGVYCRRMNSASKIAWMIVIAAVPVLGVTLYLLMGRKNVNKRMRKHFSEIDSLLEGLLGQEAEVWRRLVEEDPRIANEFRYILNETGMPVFSNTDVRYFPDQADAFEKQLEELEKAEKFIFLEYYAIEDRESFARVKRILRRKAAEGVEVRLFYDEIGSISFLTQRFIRQMEAIGIDCRVFIPVAPVMNLFMNNRDHRKIMVVDNRVAFTGGYNLANEYFHLTEPYGYWKDSGIMLKGDAVSGMTLLFLEMWNAMELTDTDFMRYLRRPPYTASGRGFVQPYAGTPMRDERVAEEVYMNVLRGAQSYVYFVSPYLVITDEMSRELTSAAKRGIDVRIVIPGIPDKKTVYLETRSFLPQLVRAGVRIFIYTPGFSHAKMCVSDDLLSIVGTINLDYRSLYLHFENAVLVKDGETAEKVRLDFEDMFGKSREYTEEDTKRNHAPYRFVQAFLRLIAPLL